MADIIAVHDTLPVTTTGISLQSYWMLLQGTMLSVATSLVTQSEERKALLN